MDSTGDVMVHYLPLLLMLSIVAVNHLITHQRTERRYALEALRLRAALSSELRALQDTYQMNLDLISRNEDHLMSVRSPVMIYRSNLGRVTSLFESELVDELVSLFARNETIEALLAAHGTSKGGLSYLLTPKSKVEGLKQMLAAGVNHIEWTRQVLDQTQERGSPTPVPAEAPPHALNVESAIAR